MNIRQRFLAMFALAAILPIFIAGTAAFALIQQSIIDRAIGQLDALAAIQENRVEDILERNDERLVSFTNRFDLRRLVAERAAASEAGDAALTADADARLSALVTDTLYASDSFHRVSIIDHRGVVVASTDVGETGADVSTTEFYLSGRESRRVWDVHRDPTGLVLFRLVGPIFSEGQRVGVALIEVDAANLFAVANDVRALGQTGETIIARPGRNGGAELVTPLRTAPDSALRLVILPEPFRPPIIEALGRREETFEDVPDYRGVKVYAATRYLESAGYGIVVKMDSSEVRQPLVSLFQLLAEAIIAAVVAAVALAAYAAGKLASPIVRLTAAARRIAEGRPEKSVDVEREDEVGELARSFTVMVDKLLAERLRLEASVKSLPVGVLVVDAKGTILLRNERLAVMLGLPSGSAYSLADVAAAVPKRIRLTAKFHACVKKGKDIDLHDVAVGDRTLHLLLSPIRTGSAGEHGFVLLAEDVSEERRLEQAKADFVSIASHQLRTPLTAIKGAAEMLREKDLGPLNERQSRFVQEIQDSDERMIDLINALLDASRMELGVFAVEPEPTDFGAVADSVLRELDGGIKAKRLRIDSDVALGLEAVPADPKLLRMIFQNLLSNAVKYTPDGGRVGVGIRREGGKIVITVSDTGYGIPAEQQGRIFTKMFRADNVRRYDTEGTGLGLYIVRATVNAIGGSVTFTSVEGAGTTFTVTLPGAGMLPKDGLKVSSS